eukprot:Hpha_TRINITY_DN16420_c2_g1::TRINITY_DN16420_c2_g1_i2::g.163314::m.163314
MQRDANPLSRALQMTGSLADARAHPVPEDGLRGVAIQALQGLDFLHRSKRRMHRDIKPANILYRACSGEVKLSDFGSSSETSGSGDAEMRQSFVGTLCYMAPERIESHGYGYTADCWGLGVTLLEVFAGGGNPLQRGAGDTLVTILDRALARGDLVATAAKAGASAALVDFLELVLSPEPSSRPPAHRLLASDWVSRGGDIGAATEAGRRAVAEWAESCGEGVPEVQLLDARGTPSPPAASNRHFAPSTYELPEYCSRSTEELRPDRCSRSPPRSRGGRRPVPSPSVDVYRDCTPTPQGRTRTTHSTPNLRVAALVDTDEEMVRCSGSSGETEPAAVTRPSTPQAPVKRRRRGERSKGRRKRATTAGASVAAGTASETQAPPAGGGEEEAGAGAPPRRPMLFGTPRRELRRRGRKLVYETTPPQDVINNVPPFPSENLGKAALRAAGQLQCAETALLKELECALALGGEEGLQALAARCRAAAAEMAGARQLLGVE